MTVRKKSLLSVAAFLDKLEQERGVRMSPKTVYRWVKAGLPVERIGTRTYFLQWDDYLEWQAAINRNREQFIPKLPPSPSARREQDKLVDEVLKGFGIGVKKKNAV